LGLGLIVAAAFAMVAWSTELAETQFFLDHWTRGFAFCLVVFLAALFLVHRPKRDSFQGRVDHSFQGRVDHSFQGRVDHSATIKSIIKVIIDLLFPPIQGRVNRAVWWVNFIISICFCFLITNLGMYSDWVYLFGLLLIWPSISINVRRYHDMDKSGWWVLLPYSPFIFLPLIGPSVSFGIFGIYFLPYLTFGVLLYWLIVCGFFKGTVGNNRFGSESDSSANEEIRGGLQVIWSGLAYAGGAAFYLFMPLASVTNPPINWGYPRTWLGFT
ncbi:uncharacterized protein METZ01_LOCUS422850, partial [marine metagenome]